MARPPGATLQTTDGSYRIHEVVAVGGFASVYFGRNLKTNVPVAVKMLHPHHIADARVVRHFVNEASLARDLRHPNVVGIIDRGQADDGQPFIVMEWMTGWTIGTLISERGAFAIGEAAFVIDRTLNALAAAHARRIYHRDIKPANLMLTADGVVKVMDFGISKDASLSAASGASGMMGTPAYMAPEQFRGEVADGRTDLYAVGVTLYQMLAGTVPFESTSTHGYMYLHLEKPPPSLRAVRPDLPPAVEQIVQIALAKPRDRRFQSAEAMAAALSPFSGHSVVLPSRPPDTTIVSPMTSIPAVPNGAASMAVGPPSTADRTRVERAWDDRAAVTPAPPERAQQDRATTPPAFVPPAADPYGSYRPDGRANGPAGWTNSPAPVAVPPPRSSKLLPILGLAGVLLVGGGLLVGYLLLDASRSAQPGIGTPVTTTTNQPAVPPAASGPTAQIASAAGAQPGTDPAQAGPSPSSSGTGGDTAALCGTGLTAASAQRQQRAFTEAATTLESLRANGCDVSEPLYDVYLDLGRDLADADRVDDAIARFDLALQVKNGEEARSARAVAAAYREGRGAIARQSWDDAIQKLEMVNKSSPTYARGNGANQLAAAYLGKGDELRRQSKHDDALEAYSRAAQLKRNDPAIFARVRDAQAERDALRLAEAAAREPTATAAPPTSPPTASVPAPLPPPPASPLELESVARAYYAAIDERRYEQAYALLSAPARQQQTIEQFRGRFTNTRRILVRSIDNARIEGSVGFMSVHTQTVNITPQGDVTACSRVTWELVREPQGWRRDVVSGSGNEQGERC